MQDNSESFDLQHSTQDWKEMRELLQQQQIEEGHQFDSEQVKRYAEIGGDDQRIHVEDDQGFIQDFHDATSHIMSEDSEPQRNIVHGALTASMATSRLPEAMKRNPTKISARFPAPAYHSSQGSDYGVMEGTSSGQEVSAGVKGKEDRTALQLDVLETDPGSDIDYEAMMYAVSKGMGFQDREGDVLLGFPEIEFTEYDIVDAEELYLERDILRQEDSEAMGLDEIGDVTTYENTVVDQNGDTVVTYQETDLEIEDFPEENSLVESYSDFWSSTAEANARIAGANVRAVASMNPFL